MCGICGIMKHRGPDDEGVFIENTVGLGFVRLSIIDLSLTGHQPMFSNDNRYVIIFNGEIYNYIELREELKKEDIFFKTQADTEVLLNAFLYWGEDCMHRFNGMWSFVIYDCKEKKIFAARDRYGVKPFYYYLDKDYFIFASEIPAILSYLKETPQPNNQAIFDYLVFNRSDHSDSTFFSQINKLLHGHSININLKPNSRGKQISFSRWYNLSERVSKIEGFSNPEEYHELFCSSVELRLRSDVPVGTCFSGGLDSSSIVSTVLNTFNIKDINTFSAIYGKGLVGDEQEYIMLYRNQLKNMHFVQPTVNTFFTDLNNLILTHPEPFPDTSIYAGYEVMKLAHNHVTVVLDGQGADEQLAGYHYFFGFFFKELLISGKITKLLKEMAYYVKEHKNTYGLKTFIFLLLPRNVKTSVRIAHYLNKSFTNQHKGSFLISGNLYNSESLKSALINHFELKLEHLLKWEDLNSMRFSLESRTPFLDYRLVEKTLSTSGDRFIKNGMTKVILREAMKNIIPDKITNRKSKIGFSTPESIWFRDPRFEKLYYSELETNKIFLSNYFELKELDKLYINYINGHPYLSKEIWKVVNLSLWSKLYFGHTYS
jgi:asparagine synthase (glutamine-hydrolysing)